MQTYENFIRNHKSESELLCKDRQEKLLILMSEEEKYFIELNKIPLDIIKKYLIRDVK